MAGGLCGRLAYTTLQPCRQSSDSIHCTTSSGDAPIGTLERLPEGLSDSSGSGSRNEWGRLSGRGRLASFPITSLKLEDWISLLKLGDLCFSRQDISFATKGGGQGSSRAANICVEELRWRTWGVKVASALSDMVGPESVLPRRSLL